MPLLSIYVFICIYADQTSDIGFITVHGLCWSTNITQNGKQNLKALENTYVSHFLLTRHYFKIESTRISEHFKVATECVWLYHPVLAWLGCCDKPGAGGCGQARQALGTGGIPGVHQRTKLLGKKGKINVTNRVIKHGFSIMASNWLAAQLPTN